MHRKFRLLPKNRCSTPWADIILTWSLAPRHHPAEDVVSQLLGRQDLNGGEDDVVDARPEHEEEPVPVDLAPLDLAHRHHDDLDGHEDEDLSQPRYEVPHAGDDVLLQGGNSIDI